MDPGRAHGLSAYDAAYVGLALRKGVIKDETMRGVLTSWGIEVMLSWETPTRSMGPLPSNARCG